MIGEYVQCRCAPGCAYAWFDGRPCCYRGVIKKKGKKGEWLIRDEYTHTDCWIENPKLIADSLTVKKIAAWLRSEATAWEAAIKSDNLVQGEADMCRRLAQAIENGDMFK